MNGLKQQYPSQDYGNEANAGMILLNPPGSLCRVIFFCISPIKQVRPSVHKIHEIHYKIGNRLYIENAD